MMLRMRLLRRAVGVVVLLGLLAAGTFVVLERTMPPWYARLRYPLRYSTIVRSHAQRYHLDPALLAAVIYTESKFDPNTVSSAGAVGLMQLLPTTAEGIAERTGGNGFRLSDLRNPEINVRYGAWYLEQLEQHYRARADGGTLALAAYNAGEGAVDRWVAAAPAGGPVQIEYGETRAYVAKVRSLVGIYHRAYARQLGYG
jgi:soluble lytic murein transglycosylase